MERFSNIKAHTIRTWEKRYKICTPQRNSGNIRNYSLDDVSHLLNLSLLTDYGFKISQLAGLSSDDMQKRLTALKADEARKQLKVNALIRLMYLGDIDEFEATLDECIMAWGIDKTIRLVIMPFLEKTDLLSYNDTSMEAHFVITAVRRKLVVGIEKMPAPTNGSKTALLFLPKNEHYDLVLLYISYMLKINGLRVLYLGTNISLENLNETLASKTPDYLYCYITSKQSFPLIEYVQFFSTAKTNVLNVIYADERNNISYKAGGSPIRFVNYRLNFSEVLLSNS